MGTPPVRCPLAEKTQGTLITADRLQLIQLARDMDDEADKIEAEQRESARPSG